MTNSCYQMNSMFTAFCSGCFSARNFNIGIIVDTILMVSVFVAVLVGSIALNINVLLVIVVAAAVGIVRSVIMNNSIVRHR